LIHDERDGDVLVTLATVLDFLMRFSYRFLYDSLVCALLSNQFGIQTSSGSHSTDPNAARLLGALDEDVLALAHAVSADANVLKAGFSSRKGSSSKSRSRSRSRRDEQTVS
jgi:hypothetical protein